MSTEKKKNKLPFIIIIVVAVLCVAAAAVAGYFYQMSQNNKDDSNSSITKVESENDAEKGDVDASLQYAGYATLLSEEKIITLNFTNPLKSKKSLNLEIVAEVNGENITLATTDTLHPGHKIDSVKYDLDREIPKGNYPGKFLVHFYDERGKEEIVNSEIAINIYVK